MFSILVNGSQASTFSKYCILLKYDFRVLSEGYRFCKWKMLTTLQLTEIEDTVEPTEVIKVPTQSV